MAKDKDLVCGVSKLSLPKEFPLTPACAIHDVSYSTLRQSFLKAYLGLSCLAEAEREIDRPYWKTMIKYHDEIFYMDMLKLAKTNGFIKCSLYTTYATILYGIVKVFGWKVWRALTLREWLEKNK